MINNLVLGRCIGTIISIVLLVASLACIAPTNDSRINQLKAVQAMLVIREAEKAFNAKYARYAALQDLASAGFIDRTLANGNKDGYKFEVTPNENGYKALATPLQFKITGAWAYYLDETGILRGSPKDGNTVGPNDYPVNAQ